MDNLRKSKYMQGLVPNLEKRLYNARHGAGIPNSTGVVRTDKLRPKKLSKKALPVTPQNRIGNVAEPGVTASGRRAPPTRYILPPANNIAVGSQSVVRSPVTRTPWW